MELEKIYNKAVENNLCEPWQKKMRSDLTLKNLCQMYFDGDDWAMENDFPKLGTLKEFKGKSEVFGLFTDYIGMPNIQPRMAFFGESEVKLVYSGFSVSTLIIRHNSKVNIQAVDNAIVFVNLLDNAELEIEALESSKVEVFSYNSENVKSIGNVKVQYSSFKK